MKKTYLSPIMEIRHLCIQTYLQNNSITSVSGLSGVEKGEGDFSGGSGDAKYRDSSSSMGALW